MKNLILFILFCGYNILTAQEVPDKQILKHLKAKKIEWISKPDDLAKVLMKSTKNWGVYRIEAYEHSDEEVEKLLVDKIEINYEELVAPKFDSIGWFKDMEPFIIVKNNKKYGILMNPYEVHDSVDKANYTYDAVKIIETDDRYYSLVQQNKKWGLIDWFEELVLVDPSFEKPEDVPLVWIEPWAKDIFVACKKKLNADIIIFDEGNGDGVFKARDKASKKWGMYQSLGADDLTTLIPANYDSINFFNFNGKYTAVYNENEGKVGMYLSYWSFYDKAKQTVPCAYEDYKNFDADGVTKLALKKTENGVGKIG